QRSDKLPQIGLYSRSRIAIGDTRNAEIEDFRLAGLVNQYVGWFEIAVDEAALMRMVYGFADLHHDLQTFARVQMMGFGMIPRCAAVNKLHREIGLRSEAGIHSAGFVDLSDAGVLQSAKRLRFLTKAPHQFGAGHAGLDDLEGHDAPGLALFGFIDSTHSAFTDQP